ncbi:MAG TPA: multicopper oxidase domain-containing protein [Nitrosopumilaceae archaeon]|nr:multicopper oxidase domain-containing protein [Nitrosopumilaceae archaeon]
MVSSTIMFSVIIVLAVALTGVVVYMFTENSHQNTMMETSAPSQLQGTTRTYYIASDEVKWNFAPAQINLITGKPYDNDTGLYVKNTKDHIGSVYLKCLYQGYTDDTFTTLQPVTDKWKHLGVMGPVIHAEVGDTVKVVFKNNCRIPTSMHPHGLFYLKESEGAQYNDNVFGSDKGGAVVLSGENYTYTWQVPQRAGPGPNDPSSVLWMYHSHVDEVGDTYAGLVGPIIVTRHGMANPDGTPRDVDQEFVTLFTIFDENRSPYLDYNSQTFPQDPKSVNQNDPDFIESNKKHSINGYIFGNLPGLEMKENTHVRWYVAGMGTETDIHTPHWHGQTLLMNGMRTDMVELLPMSMKVLDMVPDDTGIWLFHCHVNDHIKAGMLALFTVEKNNQTQSTT